MSDTQTVEKCKHLERRDKRCVIQQDYRPRCPCVDYEAAAAPLDDDDDDDEARLQCWCDRTERIADRVSVAAIALTLIAFVLLTLEWVRIYRSLPPGSLRSCGHESNRMSVVEDNSEAGGYSGGDK